MRMGMEDDEMLTRMPKFNAKPMISEAGTRENKNAKPSLS
jgi:hypothetical protein